LAIGGPALEMSIAMIAANKFEGEPQPSQFKLSPEVGVGVAYRINEKLGLNVQPTLRMQLESPTFISRIGLGTTLFFKF